MHKDYGGLDLEWLRSMSTDQTKDFLLSIHGLGLKSVECIRLLTLHHLAFPVRDFLSLIVVFAMPLQINCFDNSCTVCYKIESNGSVVAYLKVQN